MHIRHGKRQKGSVLIISLMMLLVLTIIGIAAVSNATLEERMANNFQQSTLVFQGAETAIKNIVIAGNPTSITPPYDQNKDQLLKATDAAKTGTPYSYPDTINTTGTLDSVPPVTASSTITPALTMCTNNSLVGSSFVCHAYDVSTQATIASSNADTTHLQGLQRMEPGDPQFN